jgi:CBS domain-containing protein
VAVRGETRGVLRRRASAIPGRDAGAIVVALVFLALGFGAIVAVRKVGDVTDGAVLASALILPAILYLLISGRVTDLKGPGGLEISIAEVANRSISVQDEADSIGVDYDQVREVRSGRTESFLERVRSLTPDDPVLFTLKLGSGPINGTDAADYAKGLTQFPRFRFVAIIDSHDKLVSYMDERAFRHLIESNAFDAQQLLNNIEQQNVGAVRAYPGMIQTTIGPKTSVADALREMERLRTSALLVSEDGELKGIVERDHLANALLLKIFEHASR